MLKTSTCCGFRFSWINFLCNVRYQLTVKKILTFPTFFSILITFLIRKIFHCSRPAFTEVLFLVTNHRTFHFIKKSTKSKIKTADLTSNTNPAPSNPAQKPTLNPRKSEIQNTSPINPQTTTKSSLKESSCLLYIWTTTKQPSTVI